MMNMTTNNYAGDGRYPGSYYAASANSAPERPALTGTVDADVCIGCGLCERSCVRYPQAIRVRPRLDRGVA